MRQKLKRILSALLAGVLTFSGLLSSFPSYAEEETWYEYVPETVEDGVALVNAEELTEPQKFNLTLLYDETVSFTYDTEKVDHEDEDTKDIVLSYDSDEKVEITMAPADGMTLSILRLVDHDKKDYKFTWDDAEMKLSFQMPSEDIWLYTKTEEILVDEPAEGTAGTQERAEKEETAAAEAVEGTVDNESNGSVSKETDHEEDSGQANEDAEYVPSENEEIDDDGLPSQGSVVTVDAISIPFDTWDFDAETDFTNIEYDPDLFTISYVSDDIVYDEPGTYSSIYHVTDNASGKFWFVLRPVIVIDAEAETEPLTEPETEEMMEIITEEAAEPESESVPEEEEEESLELASVTVTVSEGAEVSATYEDEDGETIENEELDINDLLSGAEFVVPDESDLDFSVTADEGNFITGIEVSYGDGTVTEEYLDSSDEENEGKSTETDVDEETDVSQAEALTSYEFSVSADADNPAYVNIKIMPLASNVTITTHNKGGNYLSDVISGLSYSSLLSWLSSHADDDYYLGTPYPEDANGNHIGGANGMADRRNPNGDCSRANGSDDYAGVPMMNCTGFVWHALWKGSSLSYSQAYNTIPGLAGWVSFIRNNNLEYRNYESASGDFDAMVDAMLSDGYIEPGDIIWIWEDTGGTLDSDGLPSYIADNHHVGIYCSTYFGDSSTDTWWHSIGYSATTGKYYLTNLRSQIMAKGSTSAISVIKIGGESSGYAALQKSSDNTSITNGNSAYSLAGAEYTVKDSSGNTVGTLTTKSDGSSNTLELPLGTYTVTEKTAPEGYKKDGNTYTISLTSDNTEDNPYQLKVSDEPLAYPTASLALEKATPYATTKSLADAQFEVKFYAGATSATGTPTKTWVLKSDEEFNVIIDNRHKVSGDSFYTNSDSEIVLPLGFYTIQEIVPPEGYQLSEDIVTYTVTDSNGSAKLVTDGSTVVKQEPVISDEPIWGGIEIDKRDIETEDGQPQGDATLEGAVYSIINMNDYDVALKTDENTGYGPGEEVLRITTDENGHAESGIILQYGSYKVVEVEPPTGYTAEGENTVFEFTIENNDEVFEYTVKNRVIRFDIQLIKFRDTLSSEEATDDVEPIEGVTFGIYLKRTDELILTITTDEEGVATTADPENYPYGRLPYGTYVIRELEYPEDVMPVEDFEVFGEIDGKTYSGIYKNDKPIESGITVVKTDAETGKIIPLAGTEFQILDENGEVMTFNNYYPHYEEITNFVTDDSGTITLPEKLPYGNYYLHEVNAPYGYLLAEDIAFEITEFNYWPETVTVELPDFPEKGQIVVSKYDAETKESISGAVFAVFADEDIITADGTVRAVKDQYMEAFTIGEDGMGMSSELYLGTYYVQEIQAPSGYCLDDTRMRVTLEYEDQETPVTYAYLDSYNAPTTVIIRKTDEEGEMLEGVRFEITPIIVEEEYESAAASDVEDADEVLVEPEDEPETESKQADESEDADEETYGSEEYVTDADGLIIKSYLKPGIYMIKETQTLEHYILDDTERYVTVDRNGFIYESDEEGIALDEDKAKSDTVTLTWVNEFSSVPVEVSKKDITGEEELPGAKLSITDEDGNLIDEWTSTTEPHKANLFAGTYTLTEITAPTGYATTESIEFTIDSENVVHGVTMYDSPLVLEVSKKDITDNEELPGAHLRIEDEDGNKIDEWTSTDEPHVIEMIPAGNYKLIETTAPDGYATAEIVEFTVTDTAEIQHVEMYDSPTQVEISKKDITDDEELPGAHLIVKDKDGDTVDEWTSTTELHIITNLPQGTYTLTEVTAPNGYEVAETITFTVEDTCDVQHVQMYDSPKEDTVDLTGLTTTTTATPTSGSTPSSGDNVTASTVKTGDYFRYGAAILLVACGAALLVFTIRKRKQAN